MNVQHSSEPKLILYGIASPYTFEAIEIIKRLKLAVHAFVHNYPALSVSDKFQPLLTLDEFKKLDINTPIVIPLITPGHRKKVVTETTALGFSNYYNLIDPTAILASSNTWGIGFNVNAGVVVGANTTFENHVLINRSVSIGHDVVVKDYVSFGPASVVCGTCTIGEGSFIGANATILPNVNIGKNAVVGAGSLVSKDVPDNSIVTGNPAKIIKTDINGYNNVSV